MRRASTLSVTALYCATLCPGCLDASGAPVRPPAPAQRIAPEGGPPATAPTAGGQIARNPTRLVLMQDGRKVFGWISGARSYAGEAARVTLGQRTARVRVDSENTFCWYYEVKAPSRARVHLAGLQGSIALAPRAARRPGVSFAVLAAADDDQRPWLPGAHELVVLTGRGDRTIRSEIGCVAREAGGPALSLRLDRRELGAGQRLTGTIRSRFAGARVLLSLCDGDGIRAWRAFRLKGRSMRLNLLLPAALGRHVVMDVQYVDRAGRVHVAEAALRVRPGPRTIEIY